MGTFTAGCVVLIPFPFSDLSRTKLRPAVILATLDKEDCILCQITSQPYDTHAIELTQQDFSTGSLQRTSYAGSTSGSGLAFCLQDTTHPRIMQPKILSDCIHAVTTTGIRFNNCDMTRLTRHPD